MCLAVPGRVVEIRGDTPEHRLARVDFGGVLKEVQLGLLPQAKLGDYVLVHVGLAIARVDEDEARQVFEYLKQMDALDPELTR